MPLPHSKDAQAAVHALRPGGSILDVGAGSGGHTRWFESMGHEVVAIDAHPQFEGCFEYHWPGGWAPDKLLYRIEQGFDVVWAAHVLEHSTDPHGFLDACRQALKPDGLLALTVPPMKPEIVGGHVTLWNAGLLLYNLVLAGFDCSQASVKTYDYNVSVLVPNTQGEDAERLWKAYGALTHDHGDIERLAEFFPLPVAQGFNGNIKEVNWP